MTTYMLIGRMVGAVSGLSISSRRLDLAAKRGDQDGGLERFHTAGRFIASLPQPFSLRLSLISWLFL